MNSGYALHHTCRTAGTSQLWCARLGAPLLSLAIRMQLPARVEISEEMYLTMLNEGTKTRFETMTKTIFKPYDIRPYIDKGEFKYVVTIIVKGKQDPIVPRKNIEPITNLRLSRVLSYNCDKCDNIIFGKDKKVAKAVDQLIWDILHSTDTH